LDKIWLKNYPPEVPVKINPEDSASLQAVFDKAVKKYPNRLAVSNFGHSITYKELNKRSKAFAGYLQKKLKLKRGDRFAIMMPNLIQYIVALHAAFKAGLIVVNVNPLYTPRELIHQLNDAEVETILVLENFAHTVQKSMPKVNLKHVIVTRMGDELSFFKKHLINFMVKRVKKMVPAYHIKHALSYAHALTVGAHIHLHKVPLTGEDLAFLQYTGGTTGRAKGAMLTHRNMVANVEQAYHWVAPFADQGQDIVITPLPLYHVFSLLANCMVFTKCGSLNVLITNPRDLNGFVKVIKRWRFTCITGVNTLFNALVHHHGFKKVDFSGLKVVLGGGMAVQQSVAEKWQKITGHPILEAYGLTETSPAVTINPLNRTTFSGSIGLPVPSTEIRIVNDDNEEQALGDVGELCVRGPQVMKGYWNMPEDTREVIDEGGWLHTGDIARVDDEGYVYIVDRKKDMVDVSGFNVYPNEVEEILVSHPDIVEAAVIGVPNPLTGEALRAFIVVSNKNLIPRDIIKFCRERLTPYKVPKAYVFKDELPKSNVGKILRRELREEALENCKIPA
jgi:long-chain acyl-CoA synthetase